MLCRWHAQVLAQELLVHSNGHVGDELKHLHAAAVARSGCAKL